MKQKQYPDLNDGTGKEEVFQVHVMRFGSRQLWAGILRNDQVSDL